MMIIAMRSMMDLRVWNFSKGHGVGLSCCNNLLSLFSCVEAQWTSHKGAKMKTSIVRHDTPTIILHWSVALLIVCASFSSFFLNSGGSDVSTTMIETFHNVTGTLALGLVIVWFGWRALHEEMPKLASISNNEHRFMELTNGVLKSLLLLVPATGIMHLFASGKSIDVGMLKLTYVISMTQQNFELLGLTHNVLGKLLLAVAFVHSAHALWHHFRRRDGFVRRILPWVAK